MLHESSCQVRSNILPVCMTTCSSTCLPRMVRYNWPHNIRSKKICMEGKKHSDPETSERGGVIFVAECSFFREGWFCARIFIDEVVIESCQGPNKSTPRLNDFFEPSAIPPNGPEALEIPCFKMVKSASCIFSPAADWKFKKGLMGLWEMGYRWDTLTFTKLSDRMYWL